MNKLNALRLGGSIVLASVSMLVGCGSHDDGGDKGGDQTDVAVRFEEHASLNPSTVSFCEACYNYCNYDTKVSYASCSSWCMTGTQYNGVQNHCEPSGLR